MELIFSLCIFFAGLLFGKLILNQNKDNYDLNLISLALFFFVLGYKTIIFSTQNFKLSLAYVLPPFILGALARRLLNKKYSRKSY
jgi:hypothetical protein